MYYYLNPTPQNVLFKEPEIVISNSDNGKEIYELNIDDKSDRQIVTVVHQMLMHSTICKANENYYRTIEKMITVGFTGQLNWWANYFTLDQRYRILQSIKHKDGQLIQNAVYTLVLIL